ncbi:MAG: proline racemase family protein, partial [Candidatus Acidiferrales bacterium]
MRFSRLISAVDAHACGEPGRVIIGGVLDVPGNTMFEKKVYLETRADDLRKLMLREPRGYPASNCNLILPPAHPEADAGFVIMEQTEYPPMSGTNTICVVTVLLETGMIPVTGRIMRLKLETPAGLIEVEAEIENFKVTRVTFQNVPAFAVHLDAPIEVRGLGTVKVDVAYGGMFYVIADAEPLGIRLAPDEARDIVRVGEMIKAAAQEQLPVAHPENPAISGVTIAQLSAPSSKREVHRKNAVIVATGKLDWNRPSSWTGALDRSPCGTGTCAKMAVLHAKGLLPLHQDFIHEGILGT